LVTSCDRIWGLLINLAISKKKKGKFITNSLEQSLYTTVYTRLPTRATHGSYVLIYVTINKISLKTYKH